MANLHLLVASLALYFILCTVSLASGARPIKSSDELSLDFLPESSSQLFGQPGTVHQLAFKFWNRGLAGNFRVSQSSSNTYFTGLYEEDFSLDSNMVHTVHIRELQVPNDVTTGQQIEVKVTVKRTDRPADMEMEEISRTVLFTVGPTRPDPNDEFAPEASVQEYEATCPVPRNSTRCEEFHWQVDFRVQDDGNGLRSVEVDPIGRDFIGEEVQTSYPNFEIGTTVEVEVVCKVSCCTGGVALKAVDLGGYEKPLEFFMGSGAPSICASFGFLLISMLLLAVIA